MSPTARSCAGDQYLAQQSIRTFFNISQPAKRYVKTSLSILNMGFMRGLSPYYMSGTPAINEYIHGLIASDPWLRANGFTILREAASLGFRNYYYEAAIPVDTPYKKMFSALWRQPAEPDRAGPAPDDHGRAAAAWIRRAARCCRAGARLGACRWTPGCAATSTPT